MGILVSRSQEYEDQSENKQTNTEKDQTGEHRIIEIETMKVLTLFLMIKYWV